MRGQAVHPIVIAAGGTGGHFFPAEALAAELLARGQRVALMTDARSAGQDASGRESGKFASGVFANAERFVIRGAGIAGRGPVRAIRAAAALAAGTVQARRILAMLNASAVVGFGGYPSVAPVLAARLLGLQSAGRRPAVVLHEQNSVLGRANRFLARHADVLALSFPATALVPAQMRTELTGLPVRPAIRAIAGQAYTAPRGTPTDTIALLILGGSLGARVFSDVVPPALATLPAPLRMRLLVTQQCRAEDMQRVRAAYADCGIAADLAPFFADIAARLAAAHLVIARAGASTVAELAVAGRPAILVPLPGAIDDHQTGNAQALETEGGAWMMAQAGFTPKTLQGRLEFLFSNPRLLAEAASAARGFARNDAASALANTVEKLLRQAVPR